MIVEQLLVTHMAVFCYLVGDEQTREAALIDPAGDFDSIFERVDHHNLTVTTVINTHGHFDHTSGNDYVVKKTGAKLLIYESEARKLDSISNRLLSRVVGGKGSPRPMETLGDGDVISIGSIRLEVIHTPGHSEGSICLYTPGHVFTGDTLFTEGMGRTDLAGGSYRDIMDSIKNRILSLPDDTIIWPGHHYGRFPSSTVREQKRYYL